MIESILVQGEPGTGKSTSFRHIPPKGTMVLKPNTKPFPWRGGDAAFKRDGGVVVMDKRLSSIYDMVYKGLSGDNQQKVMFKQVLIEDFSHFLGAELMSDRFRARESGNEAFKRYSDLARDVYHALFDSVNDAEAFLKKSGIDNNDSKVVVINHTEENMRGKRVFKSAGKLLEKEIMPVSHFRIALHSITVEAPKIEDRYKFLTQDNGQYEAKSPAGMFESEYIPNDLWSVLQTVREYDK